MNSTYSHSPESQDKSPSFVFIAFSSTLALFVLAGNALVIIAFGKNTCLQTRTNMFIASLAVSDFLVGGVSMPIWIYLTSVNYPENLSGFFEFFGSFDRFSALASIFHLTAISGERYLAITRPFVHETLSSRVYKWMIMAAWVTAGLLTGFFGLRISLQFKALATVTILIIGFLIPSVLMLTVYTGIFRTARAVINRTPADHTEESIRNKVREERRVALTVTLVTALFVIAWLPFFVVSMLGQFCSNSLPKGYDQTIMVKMVKCLHYLNSAVNPFIYAFRDKKMRSSFIKLLGVRRN